MEKSQRLFRSNKFDQKGIAEMGDFYIGSCIDRLDWKASELLGVLQAEDFLRQLERAQLFPVTEKVLEESGSF